MTTKKNASNTVIKKNTGFFISLCLVILLTLLAFNTHVYASSVKELKSQQIDEILFNIHAYYVEDLALQNSDHINYNNKQFERLYSKLDPYSKYLDEHELTSLFDNTNGRYTGIGIEVKNVDEKMTIIDVVNNSPAKIAGVLPGDKIISVNNNSADNRTIDEVATLIRESKFANIDLTVKRDNTKELITFHVARRQINLESATSELLDSGTGYLAINNFSNHTLHEVALQVAALQSHFGYPLKGLVIDLRDNPGGTLKSAVAVSDLFLQSGTIVTTKGRFYDANQAFYAKRGDILKGAPIVVLINENSASAAEILAAALKDNKRATIVGSQSFGKGSVQSLIPLGDGNTALKLTTAKYYTPLGQSIDGIGITPDVAINQTSLSQTNKAVIIKNEQTNSNAQLLTGNLADQQLVKAKQLLSMQ
ncbi:peptidase S41 [Pseudoalteromonas carrageenovora]|uniref:Carboxyl-terminal processing protease n=1 Tax=Pseudoalteromonas carrageenovora IAM 12662 TaxID=1314868 RepID=A0A2K4XCS5_PSEVC|nr:S41 family peptidase [Pseudoalteromonas carrageenovora]MBE0380985.1 carboxyl-terminal processing protease [Pseudoalteromonas carrageenovora IAM 12662]QBJ73000.1 peptidase S41 [Pseudoalteromonas carrageenovora]GEB69966.1 peptidase S41 [Pseudoalteromonas carrageenovora]SOU42118.1 Peptidase S41 [Pseudoalteromonas carrageenovora IAM 12662]